MSSSSLIEKRIKLEKLVSNTEICNPSTELSIYDLMVKARVDYDRKLETGLDEILTAFESKGKDTSDLSSEMKIKSELLQWRNLYGHAPAYIFVVNFDPMNKNHTQHIFSGRTDRDCVGKSISNPELIDEICSIAYEDNAILVKSDGIIHATNVHLINLNPHDIPNNRDPSHINFYSHYGFKQHVHTRHFSSLAASYHLPELIVYTLSEAGFIRRFSGGKITFSTLNREESLVNLPPPEVV